jgi:UDP-N-acetylmuramate dehydrogenase
MTPISIPERWQRDVPLTRLTSWRIGGPARFLSLPGSVDDLRADLALAARLKLPVFALGSGSNLLFPDRGYPGLLVRLPSGEPRFGTSTVADRVTLDVPAGALLSPLAQTLARDGWSGLEWAGGIPGTIGGAVVNNAGAYGGAIADTLRSIHLLAPDGALETWEAARLELDYRHSTLKGREPTDCFLLSASFALSAGNPEETARRLCDCQERRAARIPREPSCGSVFRNAPNRPAGKLIQDAGLAGTRRGDAQISPRHANFIVNLGAARASDVLALIRRAREVVLERYAISLELEVQLVGFDETTL